MRGSLLSAFGVDLYSLRHQQRNESKPESELLIDEVIQPALYAFDTISVVSQLRHLSGWTDAQYEAFLGSHDIYDMSKAAGDKEGRRSQALAISDYLDGLLANEKDPHRQRYNDLKASVVYYAQQAIFAPQIFALEDSFYNILPSQRASGIFETSIVTEIQAISEQVVVEDAQGDAEGLASTIFDLLDGGLVASIPRVLTDTTCSGQERKVLERMWEKLSANEDISVRKIALLKEIIEFQRAVGVPSTDVWLQQNGQRSAEQVLSQLRTYVTDIDRTDRLLHALKAEDSTHDWDIEKDVPLLSIYEQIAKANRYPFRLLMKEEMEEERRAARDMVQQVFPLVFSESIDSKSLMYWVESDSPIANLRGREVSIYTSTPPDITRYALIPLLNHAGYTSEQYGHEGIHKIQAGMIRNADLLHTLLTYTGEAYAVALGEAMNEYTRNLGRDVPTVSQFRRVWTEFTIAHVGYLQVRARQEIEKLLDEEKNGTVPTDEKTSIENITKRLAEEMEDFTQLGTPFAKKSGYASINSLLNLLTLNDGIRYLSGDSGENPIQQAMNERFGTDWITNKNAKAVFLDVLLSAEERLAAVSPEPYPMGRRHTSFEKDGSS